MQKKYKIQIKLYIDVLGMICTKSIVPHFVPHFVPHLWHLWHTYKICGTLGKIDHMKLRVRISKGINSLYRSVPPNYPGAGSWCKKI